MKKIELPSPTLVLVAGVSSTGKSTLIGDVVPSVQNSFWIEKDLINYAFLRTSDASKTGVGAYKMDGPEIPRFGPHYDAFVRRQTYDLMLKLAMANLELGKHPFLEAAYGKEIQMEYIDKIVGEFFSEVSHNLKIILCYADPAVIHQRIRDEQAPHDADKTTWEQFQETLRRDPIFPSELERHDHVEIDTARPREFNTSKVLEYLVK